MSYTIALLDMTTPSRAERLRTLLPEGYTLTHATAPGDAAMKQLIQAADFAIAGQVAVSGDVLRAAKSLKLLHKWGVGVDNIDLETARELGIQVARTTGSNALAVAEFTIGMIFAALRFSAHGHAMLKQGQWHGHNKLPGETFLLSGKTVGIVGFGAIGQSLARLLCGFDCTMLYNKRTRLSSGDEKALGARYAPLDEILATADVVSLHCPLTAETANMINRQAFARMKRTAVLINVARGGVVNEDDLHDALTRRVIGAAAMDVFSIEPLPADSLLLSLDNLVVTPHLAAVTADTFEPTVRRMFGNIARVARGEPIPDLDIVI